MSLQIVHCEQGSPEWHAARAGAITASMFSEVRKRVGGLTPQQQTYVNELMAYGCEKSAMVAAGYKSKPRAESVERALAGENVGDFTAAAKDYAFRLAIERISGRPLDEMDQFETYAMRRGRELEPEARRAHEFHSSVDVVQTGLVLTEDGKFGASADGLIGTDGGAEYKCLMSPERIRAVILSGDLSEFTDQVQGCLWLTGRKWWHFCLYCPALADIGRALTVHAVERDDDYIAALETDLIEFDRLVMTYEAKLRAGTDPCASEAA